MTKTSNIALISLVGVLISAGVGASQLWPVVGWTTPNQHDADFKEAVGAVIDFRDEWKCDEYEEELIDLLKLQATGADSIEVGRKIEKLKEKIVKLDCQRFED